MAELCCEVALPVLLRTTFTYRVPEPLRAQLVPGARVVVPFRNRMMVGVVLDVGTPPSGERKLRDVAEVLDAVPALPPGLVELGRWMAGYYLAPVGEVFRALLPPAVEVRQQLEFALTDSGRAYLSELASRQNRPAEEVEELALLQLLEVEQKPVTAARLRRLPGGPAAAERLGRRGHVAAREVARRRRERTQRIVAWNPAEDSAPATKAEERVRHVLHDTRGPVPLPVLLTEAAVSRSVVERLIRQSRLKAWEEPLAAEAEPYEFDFEAPVERLNVDQQRALGAVEDWLRAGEFTVGLLHGVTGSGKTEVYLRAVEAAVRGGRSALVLVPEIALTLRIGRLARARMGDVVAVLHSALPETERAREWWRVRRGEARMVVGTRSAVFAPLDRPALIIVDEEQDPAYKQEETPRYHGRDTAIMRARFEGAVVLLGSATPALETYHHAESGKYRLLELESRVENRPLARVEVVDLREDFRRTHRAGPLSERLRGAIAECLGAGTQALVLLNRRGWARFQLCRSCGAAVGCANCSISLSYHKARERMVCHYCGYSLRVPRRCPKCEGEYLYFVGEGAEQVEERLRAGFPQARIGRLDRDAVRTKRAYQRVLGAFAAGELDILVGTQMVAKGHDFQRVTLVGVISADLALGLPDFRAAERTFQLLTQVAGRAGRGPLPGTVLVQTFYPEHYAVQHAAQQDYAGFYRREAEFRRLLHYPPVVALANVVVRDRKLENAARHARALESFFAAQRAPGLKVLGPAAAPLARLKRDYRFQFLLKAARRTQLNSVLAAALDFCAEKKIPDGAVLVDVDPVSLF
jgi:primosomal protein N' (replication factor Y) (superfamily II helicase)